LPSRRATGAAAGREQATTRTNDERGFGRG
jgi:hypothetical protein